MIAQIIPIKRLPRQIDYWDYSIPDTLQTDIKIGQLVRIPVKKSQLFGIVFSIQTKEQTNYSLKAIDSIVQAVPILSKKDLHRARIIARWYHIAFGTLLKLMLLPLQKRKLAKMTLQPFPKQDNRTGRKKKQDCYAYTNSLSHKKLLQEMLSADGQTLIVLPRIHLIDEVVACFSEEQQNNIVIWHSQLTQKEQFSNWLKIRNNEASIIIGTRGSILLPFYDLQQIIIDYSHDKEHKHWDQQPRFYSKDIAVLLQKIYGCSIAYLSYSMDLDSVARVQTIHPEKDTQTALESIITEKSLPQLIDMRSQLIEQPQACLAFAIEKALQDSNEDAFLFLQKKGFAKSLVCLECAHVWRCPRCEQSMHYHDRLEMLRCTFCKRQIQKPRSCPNCQSTTLRYAGFGTEFLSQYVEHLFAHDLNTEVIRLESGHSLEPDQLNTTKRKIYIGTSAAFGKIPWQDINFIAYLSTDEQLTRPDYNAVESVWHQIQQCQYYRNESSTFYIQTINPEHDLFLHLNNKGVLFEKELLSRNTHKHPPSRYLVRYCFSHKEAQKTTEETQRMHSFLTTTLQQNNIKEEQGKRITLSDTYDLSPRFYRGKYWSAFLIYMDPQTWYNDLIWLNRFFPNTWRIDPYPVSILNP